MLEAQLDALPTAPAEPVVRLLPRYDNYLLGYESRAFMVAEAHAKQVHPGGGLIRACLLIDGEARASWKVEKRRKGLRVKVSPFESLSASGGGGSWRSRSRRWAHIPQHQALSCRSTAGNYSAVTTCTVSSVSCGMTWPASCCRA